MRSIGLFGALVLSFALMPPAMAQNEYRQSYTAEKEHGTFIAYLKADPDLQGKSGGFISDVEVGLKWTGFFGQPVESYTLKWEAGDAYQFYHEDRNETVSLRRRDLSAYPDLQAEYDSIKPTDLVLDVRVTAHDGSAQEPPTPNNYSIFGRFDASGSLRRSGGVYNNVDAVGTREIRRTPHLVIERAGCRSSDIIPSSPRSHREFVQWSGSSENNYEQSAKNTLNSATRIVFSDLEIKSVELPNYKFKNIYDELQRRRAVPDDPVAAERKAEADAFWGTERPDASGKRVVSVARAAPCGEPPRFVAEEEDYENRYDFDNKLYSVVAKDGTVLIRPTRKRIVSYKDGVARALEEHTTGKRFACRDAWVNRHGRTNDPWYVGELFVWDDGYINRSGEWISRLRPKAYLNQWDDNCTIPHSTEYADRAPAEVVLAVLDEAKRLGADRLVFGAAHLQSHWHEAFSDHQEIVFGWPGLHELRGHSTDESYTQASARFQQLFEE